jgi:3D (Asp-Asp-Asp) domain-containing protein
MMTSQPMAAITLPKDITIRDGEEEQALRTTSTTAGEALQEAGITLGAADRSTPPPTTALTDGLVIEVRRAMPVTIAVDGRRLEIMTLAADPYAALAAAGIGLAGFDYLRSAPDKLQPGDVIEVVRVSETFLLEEEPIPFETVYQADAAMELDTQAAVSTGTPGLLRRRIRVRSENGQETGREVESEWVARVAVNQVIAYGTAVNIRALETPEGPIEYWRVVRMHVVSYTPSSSGKSPGEPGYGITASGLPAGKGVAAVDPQVVPFRSRIYVPGYGVAIAGDTGGGVKGRLIDLGYADDEYVHWSRAEDVYFLTPVPENIDYILPP